MTESDHHDLPAPSLDMDENVSGHSSSSSFVPVDEHHVQDAIQVINEDKQFNSKILDYIERSTPAAAIGNRYHVISVFGSQSTGKSTLLNKLFNTNFDVMDETRRQQTTKGIWMAYSPAVNTTGPQQKQADKRDSIFVMDVEGTDGRERGEDQDFERKAALFALSTSEVLIINVWETQIGLYQGANMGLLKTVFEVNLTLFGKAKLEQSNHHRVLLLFVIRDHIGVTPKENLADTVTQDLINMWDTLNKPTELAHLKFQDFFDIGFHTLGHKVLQPEKFIQDIRLLGDKVTNHDSSEYLFKPQYHHNIPIDGWTMYAENCWDQIDHNKDLDLPTQQILVAKFKCDEISNSVFEEFILKFNEQYLSKIPQASSLTNPATQNVDYQDLGLSFLDLRGDVLENYDLSASKYNQSIYEQKRAALESKLNEKFREVFDAYAEFLLASTIKDFTNTLNSGRKNLPGKNFEEGTANLSKQFIEKYKTTLQFLSLGGILETVSYESKLDKSVDELISKQQVVELNNIINKAVKKVSNGLSKSIVFELGDLKDDTWNVILDKFNSLTQSVLAKYGDDATGKYDFGLGTNAKTSQLAVEAFEFKSWLSFYDLIHKYISKDGLVNILQDRFDDKFRYDENGVPKLYQNSFELEQNFEKARTYSLKVLPILSIAKLSDGQEILPEYDIFSKTLRAKYNSVGAIKDNDGGEEATTNQQQYALDSDSDDDDEDANDEDNLSDKKFAIIISETDKSVVLNKFKKEIDAKFVETKRSLIQHVTQIPYYIYLVILVLGWNEFMAILRNPVFFTLLILIGGGVYAMYTLNLLKPASIVAQRMIDEAIDLGKQKLKELIIDEPGVHHGGSGGPSANQQGDNLSKIAGRRSQPPAEEIELDDLSRSDD